MNCPVEVGVALVAMVVAFGLAAAAAWACHRARRRGLPTGDSAVWAVLAVVFFAFAQNRAAPDNWYRGLNVWLRETARQLHLYGDRRPFQVAASLTIVVAVAILMGVGVAAVWNSIKRYRLAIGFAGLAVGSAALRFVSLHEVDAWNTALPWLRVAIDVVAAAGASALAVVRLWTLRRNGASAEAGEGAAP